jgi:single-stranded DNA-binding protein
MTMSFDKNECCLSGSIEKFAVIQTRTGTPMIRFTIICNKDRFNIVAFKALADATRLNDGDQVSIIGAVQSTSWEGKDGGKRYGVQFIANSITLMAEQRTVEPLNHAAMGDNRCRPIVAEKQRPVIADYQGGPF